MKIPQTLKSKTNDINRYHRHLLKEHKSILQGLPWTLEVMNKLKVGFDPDRKCLVFPIFDETGRLVNIYWHKDVNSKSSFVYGAPAKLLYPLPLIQEYPKDEKLYYVEGPKDVVTLLSKGRNSVSHLAGAGAIPGDLSPLMGFDEIIICFDNDKAGHEASAKLATKLMEGK